MTEQKRSFLYASVAVVLWSTVASAFKISLGYLNVVVLLFYASVVSTVALFAHLLLSGKLSELKALSQRDYLWSAVLGFLNPFLYYVVLLRAYFLLREHAQVAMTINWVWPITLVLLSIPLLKQRITLRSFLAIVVSFLGVFVIAARGGIGGFGFGRPMGVLLALASTVIWALFWIYNVKDQRDEAVRLFLNFAFGSSYALLAFLGLVVSTNVQVLSLRGMLGAVYVGLFEMGITFLVWLKALRLSKTTAHVANLICLVPFLAMVVLHFAAGEEIFLSTVGGAILIVGGIVLQRVWAGSG